MRNQLTASARGQHPFPPNIQACTVYRQGVLQGVRPPIGTQPAYLRQQRGVYRKGEDMAKLAPEQVKVVCSVSGDNGENNQRKLGKDYPIGQPSDPVKKINFYTSTCFEGCDIYDENGVTFIVSDGNKSHTLLDISTLFTQICGRLRDSKYKGEIIHVYSTTKYSREVTLDEFVASTKKVLAEAVSYADEINKLSDTTRIKTLSKIKYINEQYVRIEDNRLIVDKNLANMDIVNFKICRHIYRTYVNLTNELQRNGSR